MSSIEIIFDKDLSKIHDSYRTSIKIVALEHFNQILKKVDGWVNIKKAMFHIMWDGSFEDIHSYLTFGEYLLNKEQEAIEDYDIRNSDIYDPLDGSVESFFGDDYTIVPNHLIDSANHFMQTIATDACLFDVIITAIKNDDCEFEFNVTKISDL